MAFFRAVHAYQKRGDWLRERLGYFAAWVGVQFALIERHTKVAAARTAVVADAELRHVVKHTVVFCFDGDLQGDWLHLVAHAGTGKVAIICKSPGFP